MVIELHKFQTLSDVIRLVTIVSLFHHPRKLAKIYLTVTCDKTEMKLNHLVPQQDKVQIDFRVLSKEREKD